MTKHFWPKGQKEALRVVLKDFKKNRKRIDINKDTKRAIPAKWGHYIASSTAIKLYKTSDTNIENYLRDSAYVNDRLPFRPKFISSSRLTIRRQSLPYRVGPLFLEISFEWVNLSSEDILWKHLKEDFFTNPSLIVTYFDRSISVTLSDDY